MSKSNLNMKGVVGRDDPDLLVQEAQKLAENLKRDRNRAGEATKTQVRRLFGTIRQIEMSWPRSNDPERQPERDNAYRELLLFKPRMSYQAHRHRALKPLVDAIQDGIDEVARNKDREKLKRLVQFFEATVAYYIAG